MEPSLTQALERIADLEDEYRELLAIADLNLARAEEAEAQVKALKGEISKLLTDVTYEVV